MFARLTLFILLSLIGAIRGYYLLRYGFLRMRSQKPKAWYDWLAEVGALSVAPLGAAYVALGEQIPSRFAANEVVRVIGLVVFAVGVLLFGGSHFALAQQWTWNIGLRENHAIVQRGLYRYMRHPMYTAIGAWVIGLPLIIQAWLGLFPLIGLIGLYRRAQVEEALLIQTFGAEYETYRRKAGMFLPNFRF
jgi:protein-S-isoprenylcysteine O-methyltransferase Ste14